MQQQRNFCAGGYGATTQRYCGVAWTDRNLLHYKSRVFTFATLDNFMYETTCSEYPAIPYIPYSESH